jgi:ParB family transcriptional regulator, chromosome partitioning protein
MTIDLTHNKRRALGKGLAALLPEADMYYSENNTSNDLKKDYLMCPIEKIFPNAQQPRQSFQETRLKDLSESIKEHGVIQPIIVRRRGDNFEIIAGERRWRASKLAGLREIPVIIKEVSDKIALQTALVENIQRADLNSIEEARAYKQLLDEYSMTQEDLATRIGKDRSSISNYLRLLNLPMAVQTSIVEGQISMGHARAICSLDNEESVLIAANEILQKNLSVRDTEDLVKRIKNSNYIISSKKSKISNINNKATHLTAIEDRLREIYKTKVRVCGRHERGKFVIEYFNKEDFERILSMLSSNEVL